MGLDSLVSIVYTNNVMYCIINAALTSILLQYYPVYMHQSRCHYFAIAISIIVIIVIDTCTDYS